MLPPHETRALALMSAVLSAFSTTGSLFIVLSMLIFDKLRKQPAGSLILWLSVSDVGYGVSQVLLSKPADVDGAIAKEAHGTALCQTQAMLAQFFAIASFAWTAAIAHTLHAAVVKRDVHHKEEWFPRYHRLIWTTCFVFMLIPLLANIYGPTGGGFCWIKNDRTEGHVFRMLLFYVPLWLAVGYNSISMWKVTSVITRAMRLVVETDGGNDVDAAEDAPDATMDDDESASSAMRLRNLKQMRRIGLFPLILVGCWMFATINRIYEMFDGSPVYGLYALQVLSSSLSGLLNALVYGMMPSVRGAWSRVLEKWPIVGPLLSSQARVGTSSSGYTSFGNALAADDGDGDISPG